MFRVFVFIAAILTSLVFFAPRSQAADTPAYWSISNDQSTVHILGTIHFLTEGVPWLTPEIRQRFEASRSLTLELSPEEMEPARIQGLMQELGYYPPNDSLKNHLPDPIYGKLTRIVGEVGLPLQAVDRMKPWLIGVVLVAQYAQRHGYLPQYGVEVVLTSEAARVGKPVFGLESAEEQLRMLASLNEEEQKVWLEDGLEQIDDIDDYFRRMKESWLTGDTDALAEQLNEGLTEVPALAEALLYQRNRNWLPDIISLLDRPGTHFVAVGAGHLVGEQSVIDLLRAAGFEVTRH